MKTIIFHNPRCSKSREALCLLNEHTEDVEIIEYLKDTPSAAELKKIVKLIGIKPIQLVRKNEKIFFPYKDKNLTDDEVIKLMVDNPILIERPIVIKNNKAMIGRPPQVIVDIL
ncbi:MAG: arsenate reductase (glutaredoxin) [Bacteroidia bacterium]|nr:arsenate reductase (glutaredoxin) [Bacteroidia bacterium]